MRRLYTRLCALGFLVLMPGPARAAQTLVNHNTDTTTNTAAVCIAAPDRNLGSVVVKRIRLTLSRTTATTYTFTHKRTTDSVFDTEDVSSCSAPGCGTVMIAEGAVAGQPIELSGLNLVLPRGSRLYFHTDADIGAEFQTLEVVFEQAP